MSVQSIGGPGFSGFAYPAATGAPDPMADAVSAGASSDVAGASTTAGGASGAAAGAASLNFSPLSAANALQAMNGFHVTGEVSATLPNGMTVGMVSFVPAGADQDQAGASSGSSASSSGGPDYAMMAASVEQMVQAFMNTEIASQASGSPTAAAAAAQSAYLQSSTDGSTQGGATGTVA